MRCFHQVHSFVYISVSIKYVYQMQFFSLTSCTQILLFSDLWVPRLQTIWYCCLVTRGQTTSQKCSKLAPSFFSPDWCTLLVSYGSVSTRSHSPWHWVSHFSRRVLLLPAMTSRSRPASRLQNHLAKSSVEFGVSSALCSKSLQTLSSGLLQQISNLEWTVVTENNDIKVWCSRLCNFLDHIVWHNLSADDDEDDDDTLIKTVTIKCVHY